MAGKHLGGSFSLASSKGLAVAIQNFMPKNDKAYAEGRQGALDGLGITETPYGATIQAAALINQQDAFVCWQNGWDLFTNFPGFQWETAVPDP